VCGAVLMCVAVGLLGSALNGMYHVFSSCFLSVQSLEANSVVNFPRTWVKPSVECLLSNEILKRVSSYGMHSVFMCSFGKL
jgi:hypothetical protein